MSGGLADRALLDKSLHISTAEDSYAVSHSKNVNWINDVNNGAYNGQIVFDTTSLLNNNQFIAWDEATIQVPLNITATNGTTAGAAAMNSFACGLKNGYYQIVDSLQVDINGKTVISAQPYTNFMVNYKVLTSWSADDLAVLGPTLGVCPDDAGSFNWASNAHANGDGFSNNTDFADTFANAFTTTDSDNNGNGGWYSRKQKTTAYRPDTSNGGRVLTTSYVKGAGKNTWTAGAVTANAVGCTWNMIATIRLKDLSNLFSNLPLTKGSQMRITINYNSASTSIISSGTGSAMALTSAGVNYGHTNPMMVSSLVVGSAFTGGVSATNAITTTFATSIAGSGALLSTCRLYTSSYKLNPVAERELISNPIREIRYNDLFNQNISGITSGASFNQIITNGIVNPKYLVIVPHANTASGIFATATTPTFHSPFDPAPSTTCPNASITQLQCFVGNEPVFSSTVSYDFDMFLNEISQANSINGATSTGLNSGLIGQYEWDNAYRYYVIDVSRMYTSETDTPKSITISGVNNTAITMDYYCFVSYGKKFSLDIRTGELLQ